MLIFGFYNPSFGETANDAIYSAVTDLIQGFQ